MFELGTPVCKTEAGWIQPALPTDVIYGYVCGLVNHRTHKVLISLVGAPDRMIGLCYDPSRFPDDSKDFEKAYKKTAKKSKGKSKEKK